MEFIRSDNFFIIGKIYTIKKRVILLLLRIFLCYFVINYYSNVHFYFNNTHHVSLNPWVAINFPFKKKINKYSTRK